MPRKGQGGSRLSPEPSPRPGRRAAALFCLLTALAIAAPLRAEALRRAAIDDRRLAAESGGSIYMEVLAAEGDRAMSLALAYTGTKSAAPVIRAANEGAEPLEGRFYRLPFQVLNDNLRRLVLAALYPEELPKPPLDFAEDAKGLYAIYKIKPSEALYSAVVVRFCGRIDPEEVNGLAARIAERSGIENVHRIPEGFPVKIPVDLLLPEFQPPGSPDRAEAESAVAAAAQVKLSEAAERLAGVHVILDAGHGGADSGAIKSRVYEDEHAYDVMVRVRNLLLEKTSAQVTTTIRDRSSAYKALDGRISPDTDEYLLSDPPYDLRARGATRHGVNKRWQMANEVFASLAKEGVKPERIVFISFHADVLHESLRGGMVYVPGREHRRSLPKGATRRDLDLAEGFSRALARDMVASFRRHGVGVHEFLPIRDHVIRSGRVWIPAVLRVSKVPHSLLMEVANLNNATDRKLLVKGSFRQDVAEAVVDALVGYYGDGEGEPSLAMSSK